MQFELLVGVGQQSHLKQGFHTFTSRVSSHVHQGFNTIPSGISSLLLYIQGAHLHAESQAQHNCIQDFGNFTSRVLYHIWIRVSSISCRVWTHNCNQDFNTFIFRDSSHFHPGFNTFSAGSQDNSIEDFRTFIFRVLITSHPSYNTFACRISTLFRPCMFT
jgi:hypothetical protein